MGVCRFLRASFVLGAGVVAACYGLPVLALDGAFMTGPYKLHSLIMVGHDANRHIIPIAIAVVPGEDAVSVAWFVRQCLDAGLTMRDGRKWTVVADRGAALRRGLQEAWPDCTVRSCYWHLKKNLCSRASSQNAAVMFKVAATACTEGGHRCFPSCCLSA